MTTQTPWFQLANQLGASETRYRDMSQRCIETWDYAGAARWRAMADGIAVAREQMGLIADSANATVGSVTQPPPAAAIPIP
jgi:hypothetical protein